MSDMGEAFEGWRAMKQEKRAKNRQTSREQLVSADVEFTESNLGAHLIVTRGKEVVDFWPGTGLWHVRHSSKKGRGVFGLIKFLKRADVEVKP